MSSFRPSRAQALLVFNELDSDQNGKITRSELEDACIGLGFNLEQGRRLFDRMDADNKGFLTTSDWGNTGFYKVVEFFTLMYMRRYLGLPDVMASHDEVKNYLRAQELRKVKSLPAAINLVRVNAVTRGAQAASSSGNVIYDAFRFIDTDNSGMLSKDELKDGFAALGVHLAEHVADEVMILFDQDKSGSVEYHEFVKTLFPTSAKS